MTGDGFDEMFGQRPSFRERVGAEKAPPPPETRTEQQTVGSGHYKPYGFMPSSNLLEGVDITWWMPATQIPVGMEVQYRFITRLGYIGQTHLHLVLTDCVVKLEGVGLTDLRKRLARRQATFIQAFNSDVYPGPPPTGEPCITSVQVLYGRDAEHGPGVN
jgi:hypothetical protein